MIKNVNQQNKHCTTPPSQQTYIKLFYPNQMHYNYKSNEKILKTLNAPFWYKFNSSAFKITFMPNNTITENSHWQHNIRTSK